MTCWSWTFVLVDQPDGQSIPFDYSYTNAESTIMDTPSSGTKTPPDLEQGQKTGIQKRLTLTFRHLNVRVTAPDAALGNTILSEADPRQIINFFRRNKLPKRVCDHKQ